MCGIWGWAGNSPKKFKFDKFNILGFANTIRGEDACGIASNGEIIVSNGSSHKYNQFIKEKYNEIEMPAEVLSMIGHDRKASRGIKSIENTHPFGFGSIKLKTGRTAFEFIGLHNGSLHNEDDLAKKYNIETNPSYVDDNGVLKRREKIDSEILLEIIYKEGKYDVLSEYEGGAALLWQDLNKPNTIFAFHGRSRKYNYELSVVEEERPLFVFVEGKNSIYFSSLEESLKLIGGTAKSIYSLEHNIVYEVKNGDWSKAIKHKVIRGSKASQAKTITSYGYNTSDDYYSSRKNKQNNAPQNNPSRKDDKKTQFIHKEKLPDKEETSHGKIYYNRLRYLRNGHLVSGIFTYIDFYGLYYVGETNLEVTAFIKKYDGLRFSLSKLTFKKEGYGNPPVDTSKYTGAFKNGLFYILEGVLLKTSTDYYVAKEILTRKGTLGWRSYREASVYPVAPFYKKERKESYVTKLNNEIWKDNKSFTGMFKPINSYRTYEVLFGNLVKYTEDSIVEKTMSNITIKEGNTENQQKIFNLPSLRVEYSQTEETKKETEEVDLERESTVVYNYTVNEIEDILTTMLITLEGGIGEIEDMKYIDSKYNQEIVLNTLKELNDIALSLMSINESF